MYDFATENEPEVATAISTAHDSDRDRRAERATREAIELLADDNLIACRDLGRPPPARAMRVDLQPDIRDGTTVGLVSRIVFTERIVLSGHVESVIKRELCALANEYGSPGGDLRYVETWAYALGDDDGGRPTLGEGMMGSTWHRTPRRRWEFDIDLK